MESGRDTAPEDVQNDLDGLLNSGIELAQASLEKEGEFSVFAVTLTVEGETAIGAVTPVDDSPELSGRENAEHLLHFMREQRHLFRAIAIVGNSRV